MLFCKTRQELYLHWQKMNSNFETKMMKSSVLIPILLSIALFVGCKSQKVIAVDESNSTGSEPEITDNITILPAGVDKQLFHIYLTDSYTDLEKSVTGLSDEQLNFKSAPDRWSILQTLEHIVLTEPMLQSFVTMMMEEPTHPELKNQTKSDDEIIAGMLDRSHKAQAPAMLVPKARFTDVKTALNELKENRKAIVKFTDGVSIEDLRNHISDMNGIKVDAYQALLSIPGHTMRHTLQIQEIKADPNFPKN